MPRIPTYEGPQVRSEPLRPVYQRTPDVMTGPRELSRTLAAGAELLDRRIERDAQDAAFKLELQVRTDFQRQRAALREQYKGDQADQYSTAMADWWKRAPEQYGKDASPMAKQMANRALGQLALQAEADTLGYVEGEKRRAREINFRTLQNQTIVDAGRLVNAANADTLAALTSRQITDRAIAYAAAEGLSSDVGQAMANEQLAKYHTDVAVALASQPGGAAKAQQYLRQYGSAIPLDVRTRVDQAVQGEFDNQEATRMAAGMAALPFEQQLAQAAKVENPALRDKLLQRVRENQALVMAAKQERERQVSDQAWQLVGQGRPVPEALLAQMDGKERVTLQDHLREKARRDAEGTPVKTDWAVYNEARARIVELAAKGQGLTRAEWGYLSGNLAGPEMRSLSELAAPASKGSGAQDAMMTDQQRIDNALLGLGVDKRKQPELAGQFQAEVDRRVRAASLERGNKPLTADEKQKIIDGVALDKVYVERVGPDTQTVMALVPQDQLANVYVNVNGREVKASSIPSADRQQIIRALRSTGAVVTEQAIAEMWVEGQKRRVTPPATPGAAPARPPATAPASAPMTLGTPVRPPLTQPSIYASREEWEAYRAQQAGPGTATAAAVPESRLAPVQVQGERTGSGSVSAIATAPPLQPAGTMTGTTTATATRTAPAAPASAAPTNQGASNGQGQRQEGQVTAASQPAPAPAPAPNPPRAPAPAPATARAPASQGRAPGPTAEELRRANEQARGVQVSEPYVQDLMQSLETADRAQAALDDVQREMRTATGQRLADLREEQAHIARAARRLIDANAGRFQPLEVYLRNGRLMRYMGGDPTKDASWASPSASGRVTPAR